MKKEPLKNPLPDGVKCLTCPYYLGHIKCLVNPCKECILNKRKKHPFENMIKDI